MNIFISYSTEDIHLVSKIAKQLASHATVKFWDRDKMPGEPVWKKIYEWIDDADLVLAVITDKTVSRAMAVGNEIGYAKDQDKTIIPLVATDVKDSDLGCLQGITRIQLDGNNPGTAWDQLEEQVQRLKRQNFTKNLLLSVGVIVLVWLALKKK